MPHFPDDQMHGEYATEAQRSKRLDEIETWLAYFSRLSRELLSQHVTYKHNIAQCINDTYWESIESRVRPKMLRVSNNKVVIDRHKIASLTELCVCFLQPIEGAGDKEACLDLNARLAYFMALNIIGNWNAEKVRTLFVSDTFEREHITWLKYVNQDKDFPVFSNAATWYLVELYCKLRSTIDSEN